MITMTKQIEELEKDRQKIKAQNVILDDERKIFKQKIEEYRTLEHNLREEIENISNSMGVPKTEHDRIKHILTQKEKQI